jgi:hypothetical protein
MPRDLAKKRAYDREWEQRPEVKARRREANRRPGAKAQSRERERKRRRKLGMQPRMARVYMTRGRWRVRTRTGHVAWARVMVESAYRSSPRASTPRFHNAARAPGAAIE